MKIKRVDQKGWKFIFDSVDDADIFTGRLQGIALEGKIMQSKMKNVNESYGEDAAEISVIFETNRRMNGNGGPEVFLSDEDMGKFVSILVFGVMTSIQVNQVKEMKKDLFVNRQDALFLYKTLSLWEEAFDKYITGNEEEKQENVRVMEELREDFHSRKFEFQ